METPPIQAVVKTLLVSDLVDSTRLVEELGDKAAAELGHRHDRLARDLLALHDGLEVDKTDGFLLLFERPLNAVRYALDYHAALRRFSAEEDRPIGARVGIHLGEVVLRENPKSDVARGAKPLEVEGLAKPMAARLMSLARGGQTLLTRGGFDVARRSAVGVLEEQELAWLAHGGYLFKGVPEPVEVFEVGRQGEAPLEPPADSEKVKRVVEQTTVTGWRPAPGLAIPHRANWVVEERLGEGGFGEAWLAHHKKTCDRRVFKFCYDPASLRTLQREITLFRLLKEELGDRDDISRILDWSFDEAPYFIESEYTACGSLVDWAEGQGGLAEVPLETRLEIVAQVATALAAAHSVGVLHKDVKPSNVLIAEGSGAEVRAQLSDFGVGAVTEAKRLTEAGITVLGLTVQTQDGSSSSHGGTRLYTAPEVLEGKAATLQADVYALGVMLYQMVVGDFLRALAPGWRRDVTDELLCEDIAAVVDGSPERRLGNALQLAERLRSLESRWQKREDERRERQEATRLRAALDEARRRRRVLVVTVVVFALFTAVMAIMMVRVRREAQRTERVATFLQELIEITDPYGIEDPGEARGTSITVQELLDRGREKLGVAFKDDPQTRARLAGTLGVIYRKLGHLEEAQSLLEEALALRRQVFGEEHLDIAESLNEMAELFRSKGDYEGAEPLCRESLEMRRRLLGDEHLDIAESLNDLANLLLFKGDYEGAEPLYRESLEMRRRLLGDEHTYVAFSLNGLAMLLGAKGDYEGAESLYRESLEMKRRLLGDEHPAIATGLNNLANLLKSKGDYEGAEPLYRESLEMRRRLLGDEHPATAKSLKSLAILLYSKGDYEGADPLFRESLEMSWRLLGDDHPDIATSLDDLAWLLRSKGDYEGAESLYHESLEMRRRLLGDDHPDIATSLNSLAALLEIKGDYEGAEPLYRESLEMRRRLLGDEHPKVAICLNNLARLRLARGHVAEAESLIREALEIFRKALPEGHWRISNAESILGASLAVLGRYEEAEPMLLASYPVVRDKTGESSPYTRGVLERLVALYDAWGKPSTTPGVKRKERPSTVHSRSKQEDDHEALQPPPGLDPHRPGLCC